jgi:hypothetical protein
MHPSYAGRTADRSADHSIFTSGNASPPRHIPQLSLPHAIHSPREHHSLVSMSGRNSMLGGMWPESERTGWRTDVKRRRTGAVER